MSYQIEFRLDGRKVLSKTFHEKTCGAAIQAAVEWAENLPEGDPDEHIGTLTHQYTLFDFNEVSIRL